MPTYVYRCNGCGYEFEKFQKFSEDPIKVCPVCGKETRRVFQPAGVVFKGSGWYITDSRKADGKTESKPAATASTSNESKSETKTETKDAPTTETKETPKTETTSEAKPASKDNAAA